MWVWSAKLSNEIEDRVISGFRGAGFDAFSWDGKSHSDPAIGVAERWNPKIEEWIRCQRSTSHQPIFVIYLDHVGDRQADAYAALDSGAKDVYFWCEPIDTIAKSIRAHVTRQESLDQLFLDPRLRSSCIASDPGWKTQIKSILQAAVYSKSTVLLLGQSGTGIELVASTIHEFDSREPKGRWVTLDCSTISKELSGSEFFGHVKGAFTGATADRSGAFALADGGTLFLDEIGELPYALQAELLRVIQEGSFKPVGSNLWQTSRFRLISATNRDLEAEVAAGRFRSDLFYRISGGAVFHLPPLAERPRDILPLVDFFLRQHLPEDTVPSRTQELDEYLMHREYPGNIRQLKALVARMVLQYPGAGPLTLGMIPAAERKITNHRPTPSKPADPQSASPIESMIFKGLSLKEIGRWAEDSAIQHAMELEDFNLPKVSRRLQCSVRALQLKLAAARESAEPTNRVSKDPVDSCDDPELSG
jgi:transcriptional regulator with GAF, ATPase, and Fis domain